MPVFYHGSAASPRESFFRKGIFKEGLKGAWFGKREWFETPFTSRGCVSLSLSTASAACFPLTSCSPTYIYVIRCEDPKQLGLRDLFNTSLRYNRRSHTMWDGWAHEITTECDIPPEYIRGCIKIKRTSGDFQCSLFRQAITTFKVLEYQINCLSYVRNPRDIIDEALERKIQYAIENSVTIATNLLIVELILRTDPNFLENINFGSIDGLDPSTQYALGFDAAYRRNITLREIFREKRIYKWEEVSRQE